MVCQFFFSLDWNELFDWATLCKSANCRTLLKRSPRKQILPRNLNCTKRTPLIGSQSIFVRERLFPNTTFRKAEICKKRQKPAEQNILTGASFAVATFRQGAICPDATFCHEEICSMDNIGFGVTADECLLWLALFLLSIWSGPNGTSHLTFLILSALEKLEF